MIGRCQRKTPRFRSRPLPFVVAPLIWGSFQGQILFSKKGAWTTASIHTCTVFRQEHNEKEVRKSNKTPKLMLNGADALSFGLNCTVSSVSGYELAPCWISMSTPHVRINQDCFAGCYALNISTTVLPWVTRLGKVMGGCLASTKSGYLSAYHPYHAQSSAWVSGESWFIPVCAYSCLH